jgi:CRISPR-associated protein Cas2
MVPILSEYQAMWLFAMFDLPVDTKAARREHARFRKNLLAVGFMRLQFSVYARYCPSEEANVAYRNRVHSVLPPDGQVRLISITDRQFARMEVFFGKSRKPVEDPPAQLTLF